MAQVALECEVGLVRVRILKALGVGESEGLDGQRYPRCQVILIHPDRLRARRGIETLFIRQIGKRRRQTPEQSLKRVAGIQRTAGVGRSGEKNDLGRLRAVGNVGDKCQTQQGMVIEHSIRRPYDSLAVFCWIPGDADARSNIVGVSRNSLSDAQKILPLSRHRIQRTELRCQLHVVTNAVVQSQIRSDSPAVLEKRTERCIGEPIMRIANALNKVRGNPGSIRLYGAQARKRSRELQVGGGDAAEVIDAAKIHGEICRDRQEISVAAEFEAVASNRPGEIVGDLITLFRAPHKRKWLAAKKCKSGDVYGDVPAARSTRKSIQKSAACIVETEFVDLVVADCPLVLSGQGPVVKILIGGAGERVLSEVLRALCLDFNSSLVAGADAATQHDAVVAGEIMINPQRVKIGALGHGKVSNEAIQRHKGLWHETWPRRRTGRGKPAEIREDADALRPHSAERHARRTTQKRFILDQAIGLRRESSGLCGRESLQKGRLLRSHLDDTKWERKGATRCIHRVERYEIKVAGSDRRESRLLPPRALPGKIEKGLIFFYRPAKIKSRLDPSVGWIGDSAERIHCLKISIAKISESRAVNIIRPGTRNDVHYTARRAPVLSRVAVGDDLKFLNCFLRNRGANPIHRVVDCISSIHIHQIGAGALSANVQTGGWRVSDGWRFVTRLHG